MLGNSMEAAVQSLSKQITEETERALQEQLGWLISRGLLVSEFGPTTVVCDNLSTNPYAVRVAREVKLTVKDKEYIEKLETQNKELLGRLSAIKNSLAPLSLDMFS